jgi:hypothetical protein
MVAGFAEVIESEVTEICCVEKFVRYMYSMAVYTVIEIPNRG